MSRRLLIVGCGFRKVAERARAAELYTGAYFRSCLAAALAIADGHAERIRAGELAEPVDVRILSARYGLLRLAQEVDPYDVTIGDPEAVTPGQLAAQAYAQGLDAHAVTALCGGRYVELIAQAAELGRMWADVDTPLAGLGIGHQRHVLAELRIARRTRAK